MTWKNGDYEVDNSAVQDDFNEQVVQQICSTRVFGVCVGERSSDDLET